MAVGQLLHLYWSITARLCDHISSSAINISNLRWFVLSGFHNNKTVIEVIS